ncbi:MAG: phytanoyl-CoA dioxygenase family protein [Halioglobus sp.]
MKDSKGNKLYGKNKTNFVPRILRKSPLLWSLACKTRVFLSTVIESRVERADFKKNIELFKMTAVEKKAHDELKRNGFTLIEDVYPLELIDELFDRIDQSFKDPALEHVQLYLTEENTKHKRSYEEMAKTEKVITLQDALISVPECADLAVNETIFRIVANCLGFAPNIFTPAIVRDFPLDKPRYSSHFHKDNYEREGYQAFVYLVDIDDTRGPLHYVPGTHNYDRKSCKPRLGIDMGDLAYDDNGISDAEVEKHYPQQDWRKFPCRRGSIAIIKGNGLHKGPVWPNVGDPNNLARTAIRLNFLGPKIFKGRVDRERKHLGGNVRAENFARFSPVQKMLAKKLKVVP